MDEPFKGFDKGDEDETKITIYPNFESTIDPSSEESNRISRWIQLDIQKQIFEDLERMMFGDILDNLSKKMFGTSPIEQGINFVSKIEPVKSCITCKHWKIEEGKIYLRGICQLTFKTPSYDWVCDEWRKI